MGIANARYVNAYSTSVSYKRGDALNIGTWQGGTTTRWLRNDSGWEHYWLSRRNFAYDMDSGWYDTNSWKTHIYVKFFSRACIVQGEGF